MQDDGGGLDAERIAEVAVRKGLLDGQRPRCSTRAELVSLIFQPGVSTAARPARRGQGMQIVRDHVQRLGGRMQAATKRGQYTRFRLLCPSATRTPGASRPGLLRAPPGVGVSPALDTK